MAADAVGGLDRLAQLTGIKRRTMYDYASGRSEPKVSALVAIARETEVSIEWLAVGEGDALKKTDVVVKEASLHDIRRFVWNIAETYWEETPRRTKPEAFADKFLEMFDYLLTRDDVKDDAATEVIQFGAEQLKRASGRGET